MSYTRDEIYKMAAKIGWTGTDPKRSHCGITGNWMGGPIPTGLHMNFGGTTTRLKILELFKAQNPDIIALHTMLTKLRLEGLEIRDWPPFDEQSS